MQYTPVEVRWCDYREQREEADDGGERLVADSEDVQRDAKLPERPTRRWQRLSEQAAPQNAGNAQDVGQADGAVEETHDAIEHLIATQAEKGEDDNEEHRGANGIQGQWYAVDLDQAAEPIREREPTAR